jgi:hypothetical protein
MQEEIENILDLIDQFKVQARKQRMIECQANSAMGFCYYQGIIDVCGDIEENIYKMEEKPKATNGREVQ